MCVCVPYFYFSQIYLMYLYATSYSFINLVAYHLIPVFIFATYMVIITMLHHTEVYVTILFINSEINLEKICQYLFKSIDNLLCIYLQ